MGLEGRLFEDDDLVFFGKPISEKALAVLKNKSPTASSIIKSLPDNAFIPIGTLDVVNQTPVVNAEPVQTTNIKKQRLAKKKQRNLTKIEKIIEAKAEEVTKMDLEEELKMLEQEMQPKEAPVAPAEPAEVQAAPQMKDQILQLLEGEETPPSEEMILAWKEKYGKSGIHVMAFGEGDVYIYHHLTRGEWKKIKDIMNRLRESSDAEEVEEKLKEKVVLYCTLFPKVDEQWLEYCKAGVLDSLYQMVLLNSGFLTPQQAMLLTTQL